MTNREIARTFQLLAKMMELQGENEFRIRAYRNAYDALKRLDIQVAGMSAEEIASVKGIGSSTAGKIKELLDNGHMERFDQYAARIPEGVRELLMIKGLGAGKVKTIWKQMGIETPGELLYACNENRLVEFSGFGLKTQADIRQQLEYHFESEGKFLWAVLEPEVQKLARVLSTVMQGRITWVGEYARKCPIVQRLECVVERPVDVSALKQCEGIEVISEEPLDCIAHGIYRFRLYPADANTYDEDVIRLTADGAFSEAAKQMDKLPEMPPELMEGIESLRKATLGMYRDLIDETEIRGILHCHSTYSDGLHTLREMAEFTRDAGYAYLGISDHSKSAVYARGLSVDRVQEQWNEIDELNVAYAPFRIFKGIESDILADGSLDYEDEILKGFDFVIASVHSGLKMDEAKATARLIAAIENPYTRILGHPTGRLLLARPGYPIDHHKVIDACAQNGVVIELNANPQRLDMDSSFIPYALEREVLIAINPDAHSRESIHNVRFGVFAGRRGGLPAAMCLNSKTLDTFTSWVRKQ